MRRFVSIVGGLVLAAGGMFIGSPSAEAATSAYGCTGSEVGTYSIKSGSTAFGTLHLYYDSSTGRNCAANVATTAGGYGTATYKLVWLAECAAGTKPGASCDPVDAEVQDPASTSTKYTYYAGPVTLYAPGRCVIIGGTITSPSGVTAHNSSYATACG
jgi:hypothetical protein